jgi:hypothetical protein
VSAVELVSPLPPDECVARLRLAIDPGGLFLGFGSRPVIGRVFGRWVCLRKRIGYSNGFQTFITGAFEPRGGGSVFRGKAGLHPLVIVFMAVWYAGLVLPGVMFCRTHAQSGLLGNAPLALVPLCIIGPLGAIGLRFSRYLARGEQRFLIAFMAGVLEASAQDSAEPAATADRGRIPPSRDMQSPRGPGG